MKKHIIPALVVLTTLVAAYSFAGPGIGLTKTAPISGTGSSGDPLKLTVCANGSGYTSNGTSWGCALAGDITSVGATSNMGLTGGATSGAALLGLLTTCADGQVLKSGSSGTTWTCADDTTGGGGITNSAGANSVMKSDGTNAVASSLSDSGTVITTAASLGSQALPVLIGAPVRMSLTVPDSQLNGETFLVTLGSGSGRTATNGDVFAIVVRNHTSFDTSAAGNQSGGAYFLVDSTKTGANALTNIAVEADASGGTTNYSWFSSFGTMKQDGPAIFGGAANAGVTVTGGITQSNGTNNLNSATNIVGAFDVTGTGHISSTLGVNGAVTLENTFRVNGTSTNLLAGLVYIADLTGNAAPIKFRETEAYVPDRLSVSAAASLITGVTFISGTGTAVTLAAGTKDGQMKRFSVTSGTGTITPSALYGGTVFTWSSAPAALTLAWDATGAKWSLVSSNNMTES